MRTAVFIYLAMLIFGKEVATMLVRLYAGEIILGKIQIEDVPLGLRARVSAYLAEMGYTENEAGV
jgi:hypothetical protein